MIFFSVYNDGLLICAETLNRQIDSNAYKPLIHLAIDLFYLLFLSLNRYQWVAGHIKYFMLPKYAQRQGSILNWLGFSIISLICKVSASFKKGENGTCCTYKYTQQYLA